MEKTKTEIIFAHIHAIEENVSYLSLCSLHLEYPWSGIQPAVYIQPKIIDVAFWVSVAKGVPISFQDKLRN